MKHTFWRAPTGLFAFPIAVALVTALGAPAAHAAENPPETLWLTVVGDPANPAVNTVQVDPVPISIAASKKLMHIRLNRSDETSSPQGIKFRSFYSTVEFDCAAMTARYVRTNFFAAPLWVGEAHATVDYKPTDIAPMALRQMGEQTPPRIIRAACVDVPAAKPAP